MVGIGTSIDLFFPPAAIRQSLDSQKAGFGTGNHDAVAPSWVGAMGLIVGSFEALGQSKAPYHGQTEGCEADKSRVKPPAVK